MSKSGTSGKPLVFGGRSAGPSGPGATPTSMNESSLNKQSFADRVNWGNRSNNKLGIYRVKNREGNSRIDFNREEYDNNSEDRKETSLKGSILGPDDQIEIDPSANVNIQ